MMGRIGLAMFVLTVVVCATDRSFAGCKSDCRDEYESEIDSCKLLHDDPEDADSLRSCIETAKDDYDRCIKECDS